jgi:two-component system, NtrC family, response regulator AtoC
LRRRREDIPALLDHFLTRHARRPLRFSPEALDRLIKHPWPGNVRELEHLVQRLVTLARGPLLQEFDLPPELRDSGQDLPGPLQERLEGLEREMLQQALAQAEGVQTRAAESLGISERVLRYKMMKYGLRK